MTTDDHDHHAERGASNVPIVEIPAGLGMAAVAGAMGFMFIVGAFVCAVIFLPPPWSRYVATFLILTGFAFAYVVYVLLTEFTTPAITVTANEIIFCSMSIEVARLPRTSVTGFEARRLSGRGAPCLVVWVDDPLAAMERWSDSIRDRMAMQVEQVEHEIGRRPGLVIPPFAFRGSTDAVINDLSKLPKAV